MTVIDKINYDINDILLKYDKQTLFITSREQNKIIAALNQLYLMRNYLESNPTKEIIEMQLKHSSVLVDRIEKSFNPAITGIYPASATLKQKKEMYHRKTNYKALLQQKKTLTELINYINKFDLKII